MLIYILANIAINILIINTVLGLVLALFNINIAIILLILYLESAAAIIKLLRSSIITKVYIVAKIYKAAALELSRVYSSLSL